jgi:PAS domain S-box-containing protein
MSAPALSERYRDLQRYVGWGSDDAQRVRECASLVIERMHDLIDDFYHEIQRHPDASRVITGGEAQIERLKGSLRDWLCDSLECRDDPEYIQRRWRIGLRHAEINLNPAFVAAAMSRLRDGMFAIVGTAEYLSRDDREATVRSLNKLLDVELAIIQDAYQAEHLERERVAEHERSEVKFRRLVEAAAFVVVILRSDGSIAYFSPFGEELTGCRVEEVEGKSFVESFVPEWARPGFAKEIDATFAGRPVNSFETPILCRDEVLRWLVWNAQPLDDFDGTPAVLAVGQDFTDRRDAQEQMLRSERLAGIGQMITGLAHESRNALQRIQSCSEMLELEVASNAEAMQLVRRLQEAQDNLRRLFDEVRNYAAPIQLERTACRLESVWREAWALLESARRGRDVEFLEVFDRIDTAVTVDRFRLVQLFRNLFENALAACGDPVTIRLVCSEVHLQQTTALEVRVQDNGPGLAAVARQNVFEPFFTTKTKGTGLGMAIARRIVDAHGGQIAVGNDWTEGAEFVVTLPRDER